MVEWLENHHDWVFIFALLWITVNLFRTIMSKRAKKKKGLISNDTSIGDLIGTDTGHAKPAVYGGGSGGGAGSARGFVSASSANSAPASDFNNITGMTITNSTANNIVSVEGLTNITTESSHTLVESIATITPEDDTIMEVAELAVVTTVEAVTDTALEVAGEIVEGLLKG